MKRIMLVALFSIIATGCSELRHLTMTKDELRLYGSIKIAKCLDPSVVCIVENKE